MWDTSHFVLVMGSTMLRKPFTDAAGTRVVTHDARIGRSGGQGLAADTRRGGQVTQAASDQAGETDRCRRRLLTVILAGPSASARAIGDLARAARWTPPRQVAAVALQHPGPGHPAPAPPLPPDVPA